MYMGMYLQLRRRSFQLKASSQAGLFIIGLHWIPCRPMCLRRHTTAIALAYCNFQVDCMQTAQSARILRRDHRSPCSNVWRQTYEHGLWGSLQVRACGELCGKHMRSHANFDQPKLEKLDMNISRNVVYTCVHLGV